MWTTLQYPHLLESIYMAWYNEHGISILNNILLFHGLWYYCNMMQVMLSFKVLTGLCNTFLNFKKYVMEPQGFMGYLERGNACEWNSFGHEQYHSNSPNQNNWAHGVYILHQWGYSFWYGHAIPLQVSIYKLWSPKDFLYTLREVLHMHWVILGTSNTPPKAWTKIIQSMVFTWYPREGNVFFLNFGMAMQYPSRIQ